METGKREATEEKRHELDQIETMQFSRRTICATSLAAMVVGLWMIPLTMSSPAVSAIAPVVSSVLIMGGLTSYVLGRFGAWWE
jgi:MFS superfamily sulfate permease-like transporter